MKTILLSFLLLFSFVVVNAQVRFGIKAGVNISNVTGDDTNGYESRTGFHGGVFAEIPLGKKFSVKPELLYSLQGANLQENEVVYEDSKLKSGYISIPLLAKYNIVEKFFAETGPQIGFLTSAKQSFTGQDVDVKDGFKSVDFSWAFGFGYEFPMGLGINGRYSPSISKLSDYSDRKWRNSVFQFGIFYKFGSGK